MADVEIGDVLRLGAVMELTGGFEVANVYHVRVTGGAPMGFAQASLDIQEYMAGIYANLTAVMTDNQDPDILTMQNVTQDTTFGAFAWSGWAGGAATAEQTAPGVSGFAWARTLKPRVQIRKYFGVFTEESMQDGIWVQALTNACRDAMLDHILSFEGTEGLVILGVAYNRTLLTTTDALSVDTSAEPAYQRRRRRGRGS